MEENIKKPKNFPRAILNRVDIVGVIRSEPNIHAINERYWRIEFALWTSVGDDVYHPIPVELYDKDVKPYLNYKKGDWIMVFGMISSRYSKKNNTNKMCIKAMACVKVDKTNTSHMDMIRRKFNPEEKTISILMGVRRYVKEQYGKGNLLFEQNKGMVKTAGVSGGETGKENDNPSNG